MDDAVERRTLAGLRLQRLQPGAAQSCAGDCLLHSNGKHAPPTPHPTAVAAAHTAGGAQYALRRTKSRTKLRAGAFQWPPTSEPNTTSVCGPAQVLGTRRACGARPRATRRRPRPLCGCLDRACEDTSLASQHCAHPLFSAPYTMRSSLRRSCVPTCGAVVWANHCGTTCPSDPTASRATLTQARYTISARLARSPVRGHEGACRRSGQLRLCSYVVARRGCCAKLSQATLQSDLHSGRWRLASLFSSPAPVRLGHGLPKHLWPPVRAVQTGDHRVEQHRTTYHCHSSRPMWRTRATQARSCGSSRLHPRSNIWAR